MPEHLKACLRKRARTKAILSPVKGDALLRLLNQLPFWNPPLVVASYRSLKGEWDPAPWASLHPALTFVYPRVSPEDFQNARMRGADLKGGRVMSFALARPSCSEDWEKAPYGGRGGIQPSFRVPPYPLQKVDVFLVPGLVFDRRGGRLGRGLGFYDSTLWGLKTWKVGLASHSQISEKPLPLGSHDVRMDVVVTDKEVIGLQKKNLRGLNA